MANNKVVSTSSVSRLRPSVPKTKQVTTKLNAPKQRSSNYAKSTEAPYDAKQYGNISFGRTGMTERS
jgi:hypothetical protein